MLKDACGITCYIRIIGYRGIYNGYADVDVKDKAAKMNNKNRTVFPFFNCIASVILLRAFSRVPVSRLYLHYYQVQLNNHAKAGRYGGVHKTFLFVPL
jgi:hypothetical protein